MEKFITNWSKLTLLIGGLMLSGLSIAQTKKNAIIGTWLNQEKTSKIEIYQQDEKFFGLKNQTKMEGQKPTKKTPTKRNTKILSLV